MWSFSIKEERIKRLLNIFTKKEKSKFIFLAVAILLMGFFEVIGVASILPFMQLIAEPSAVESNEWMSRAYNFFGFDTPRSMLIATGIAVLVLITFSNLFSALTIWFQYRFSWRMAHNLSVRLLRTYLDKPYSYYLTKNTSELRAYLISEVGSLTSGVLIPIIELFSRVMVALVIFGLIVFVNPTIALTALLSLGGIYALIYLLRQQYIKRLGEDRITYNKLRYRYLDELLAGIKTVKAYEAKPFFYKRYEKASDKFSTIMPKFNVIMLTPRYILEIFAFGGILSITLYLFIASGDVTQALPMLSLYALAGYRLMPALQKGFAALAKLRHNYPILDKLYDDLIISLNYESATQADIQKLPFQRELVLDNLTFQYDTMPQPIFRNFNVHIPKGTTVAFVGSTGSGKTTIVDLIVGLLHPQSGQIRLDNQELNEENMHIWHEQIAYVPQEVFLFDDTIAHNIAFGKEINEKRLKQVTQMADIYEFIHQELPKQFETEIGERGVRLSGGQRQRLGLARALYREPDVLIMDEATSALDNITEKGIIASLDTLPDDLTLIIIAHRLSTVRRADCIYLLKEGTVVGKGAYEELVKSSEVFREMAELS